MLQQAGPCLRLGSFQVDWLSRRDRGELSALGASFVVDKLGFDDQSHDGPPNCGQICILALTIKSRLPPLWFALVEDARERNHSRSLSSRGRSLIVRVP